MDNEIIKTELHEQKSEMTENARAVAKAMVERIKTGDVDFSKASKEMAHAAVTAKVFEPENKHFIHKVSAEKESELKQDFEGKRLIAEAGKLEAKSKKAEAFYKNWRPVLEFDFSNLLKNKEARQTEYKERSYGVPLMVIMLVLLTPIYCLITAVLSVINGFNAICTRISETVKIARYIAYGILLIGVAVGVVLLIAYIANSYFNINII
jgi:hypothetical protein